MLTPEPGESFSDLWMRLWYAGELGDAAYGVSTRIARIRRGRWCRIPDQWRGRTTHRQTIRKRQSKGLRKHRGHEYDKGALRLSIQERRGPRIEGFIEVDIDDLID
jgi:hypothetical protein